VAVALTVGTDGRVVGCRVLRPSRDPEADRITCALATARFRFRPARDATGNPVESVYGWQQRWFTPVRD
jgi:protein TonB